MTSELIMSEITTTALANALIEKNKCGINSDLAKLAADRLLELQSSLDDALNAGWMTKVHIICSDHGIAPGEISDRIDQLNEKLRLKVS